MNIEETYKIICQKCGGECCKGAIGLGIPEKPNGVLWLFPKRVAGELFWPRERINKKDVSFLLHRHFYEQKMMDCDGFERDGCEDKPDFCDNFHCMGIVDMLERGII